MKKLEQEELLIKRAKNGDADAFGDLVRHYESFAFNTALSFTSHPDDAFDVAQDAFLKAWQKISTFKGQSAFSTWLYRIVANTAKDALDKKARRPHPLPIEDERITVSETPEGKYIRKEEKEALERALLALDENAREVIVLREFEDLSYSEIAKLLEVSEGTVKSRLSRAREKLSFLILEQNGDFSVKLNENEKSGLSAYEDGLLSVSQRSDAGITEKDVDSFSSIFSVRRSDVEESEDGLLSVSQRSDTDDSQSVTEKDEEKKEVTV